MVVYVIVIVFKIKIIWRIIEFILFLFCFLDFNNCGDVDFERGNFISVIFVWGVVVCMIFICIDGIWLIMLYIDVIWLGDNNLWINVLCDVFFVVCFL